jgi:hypothetical protein
MTVAGHNFVRAGIHSPSSFHSHHLSLLRIYLFFAFSPYVTFKTHRTIILPVISYACETGPLTIREEHRLRMFENRLLRG